MDGPSPSFLTACSGNRKFGSIVMSELLKLGQATSGLIQRLIFLTKTEPDEVAPGRWIGKEAGTRHSRHAGVLDHMADEAHIILRAKAGYIRHDVVRSCRAETAKSGGFKHRQGAIAQVCVVPGQIVV